jgi:hypothetical protein
MRSFERREMTRVGQRVRHGDPLRRMIAPSMEYYVTAVDANTQVVATVGSETSPVQVSIVARRSHPAPPAPRPHAAGDLRRPTPRSAPRA